MNISGCIIIENKNHIYMSQNNQISGIYVIVDPEHTLGRDIIYVVKQVLDAGANIIQLRDKISTCEEISRSAYEIQKIIESYNKVFILNDYVNIAKNINTDGVHIGQKDMSIIKARKILNSEQLIGSSNATLNEVKDSVNHGSDYIAVGSMFETSTKNDTRPAGIETLRKVREYTERSIVAIGGINLENCDELIEAGADSLCIASAITKSNNIMDTCIKFVNKFDQIKK